MVSRLLKYGSGELSGTTGTCQPLIKESCTFPLQIHAGQALIGRVRIEIAENRAELGFPYGFLVDFLPSIL